MSFVINPYRFGLVSTVVATGGTVSYSGGYKYHLFDTPGVNTGSDWDLDVTTGGDVEMLIVGCGGGGG